MLLASRMFSQVVVSTDDAEIASISRDAGADLPFMRPPELADDHTPTVPVVLNALRECGYSGSQATMDVCVVYPASVFVTAEDLRQARGQLHTSHIDIVMTAVTHAAPIRRSWRKLEDGTAEMIWPEYRDARSQDLEPTYHDAGQFYWWAPGTAEKLRSGAPVTTGLYLLPRWRVHDIDTEEDWIAAERAYRLFAAADGLGLPDDRS